MRKTVFLSDQYFNGNLNNIKRLGKEYINYEIVKTKKSKSINYSALVIRPDYKN